MGLVQKVGNFLGVKKFADSLASTARVLGGEVKQDMQSQAEADNSMQKLTYALRNEKDPIKKQKLAEILQSQLNNKSVTPGQIDPGLNLDSKEIYGSAANVALNVFTPGASKGKAGAVIAKNAALGGAFGAASGLEKNRSATGVVKSTLGGALLGAGIGTAGVAAKGIKNFISETTPNWLMNNAIKPSLSELKKNIKFGTKTLGEELLQEGVKGNPQKLLSIAENKTTQFENELQQVLTQPGSDGVKITRDQIIPYVKDLIEQKAGTPGVSGDVNRIKNVIDSLPETMTLAEANQMKRRIYTELKDVAYKFDSKLGVKGATLKQVARGLKTEIENAIGGTVVKDINQKLSIYGRLENAIVDQLARNLRNNGVSLTDAILIGGGELKPSGFLAALLRKTVGSTGFKTTSANILSNGQKIGTGVVGRGVKSTLKRGVLNAP